MQSVLQKSAKFGAPGCRKLLVCTPMLLICALFGSIGAAGKPAHEPLPVDTIDARISILQKRIDSLAASVATLQRDSAKALSLATTGNAADAKRIADINDSIAKKKAALPELKAGIEKARQDSAALALQLKKQSDSVGREVEKISRQIGALQAEQQQAPAKKTKQEPAVDKADAKSRLQADISRTDSICKVRQTSLAAMTAEFDQVKRDSAAAAKKLGDDRARLHGRMHDLDSQLAFCNKEIDRIADSRISGKTQSTQKSAQLQENVAHMTEQKKEYVDRIPELNQQIAILGTQKSDYAKSADDELQHYNQLRSPLDNAVTAAQAELQRLVQDKAVLEALRQKIALDSKIAATREELDKQIQSAAGKKGSRAVDAREAKLDTLLAQRDSLLNVVPGITDLETSLDYSIAPTKSAVVDNALSANAAAQTAARGREDAAKKALVQFDATHPAAKGPAPERMALLDSIIAAKKRQAVLMTEWSDSLAIQIEAAQKTVAGLTASSKAASASVDSSLQAKNNEKAQLAKSRTAAERDSMQADSVNLGALQKMRQRIDQLAAQTAPLQNDIARSSSIRDKARQDLAEIQGQEKQQQVSAAADKAKADSVASARQKQIAQLSAERDRNVQAITALQTKTDQQIKAISSAAAKSTAVYLETQQKVTALQAQADSLRNLTLSGKKDLPDKIRALSASIAAAGRSSEMARHAIENLKQERVDRVAFDKKLALKGFHEIYALLRQKRTADANQLYRKHEAFLNANLDDEHQKALKNTIERMMTEK